MAQELREESMVPILRSQASIPSFSIKGLISQYSNFSAATINFFDPSVQKFQDATRRKSFAKVAEMFANSSETIPPHSFLDMVH